MRRRYYAILRTTTPPIAKYKHKWQHDDLCDDSGLYDATRDIIGTSSLRRITAHQIGLIGVVDQCSTQEISTTSTVPLDNLKGRFDKNSG